MLTDSDINRLVTCLKRITDAVPKKGMGPDKKSSLIRRKNLKLISEDEQHRFDVFIRHNTMLTEQFSLGLRFRSDDKLIGNITLIRFNGAHGQSDWSRDGHYSGFHIHRISQALLAKGISEPREVEMTDRYSSFDSALNEFLKYVCLTNINAYFPQSPGQRLLFEGE